MLRMRRALTAGGDAVECWSSIVLPWIAVLKAPMVVVGMEPSDPMKTDTWGVLKSRLVTDRERPSTPHGQWQRCGSDKERAM